MRFAARATAIVVVTTLAASCAPHATTAGPGPVPQFSVPSQLFSRAEMLPPDAADYARADIGTAVRPPGLGNVSRAIAIRLTRDVTVFRMWSGPDVKDANGFTNRIGSWWTYDPPVGRVDDYRTNYEICKRWNDLTWVATCTLKQGAVVAIGPGNSVSAETCSDPTGREHYPANSRDWQMYVSQVFDRIGPGKELECPDPASDYVADPRDLARPKPKPKSAEMK